METVEEQYVSVAEEEQQTETVVTSALPGDADGSGKQDETSSILINACCCFSIHSRQFMVSCKIPAYSRPLLIVLQREVLPHHSWL